MSQNKQYINNQPKGANKVQTPQLISDLTNIIKIVSGTNHCFAIDSNLDLFAWGCNLNRKLGISDEYFQAQYQSEIQEQIRFPVKITALQNNNRYCLNDKAGRSRHQIKISYCFENIILQQKILEKINHISTGTNHSFAWSTEQKKIYCWGNGEYGKLGNRDNSDIPLPVLFQQLPDQPNQELVDIVCGENHTMAIIKERNQNNTEENKLFVWGCSNDWQLGMDTGKVDYIQQPCQLSSDYWNGSQIQQIKASSNFSMALDKLGKVYSWGNGEFNKLGYKTDLINQKNPRQIESINKHQVIQLSLGSFHSAAITDQGSLFTWGRDGYGQLGHGSSKPEIFPKEVLAFKDILIVSVVCGEGHTLALTGNNELYSWGLNQSGQLGVADCVKSGIPKKISFFDERSIKQISCGAKHSLVLLDDGQVYSWGSNQFGQLGFDSDNQNSNTITNSQNSSQLFIQQTQQPNSLNHSQLQQPVFQQNSSNFIQNNSSSNSEIQSMHQLNGNLNGNEFIQPNNNMFSGLQSANILPQNNNPQQTFMSPNSFPNTRNQIALKYQNMNPNLYQNQQQQQLLQQQQQQQQQQAYFPPLVNKGTPTNPIQSHDSSNSLHSSTPMVQKNGKSPSSESSKDYLNKFSPQLIVNRQVGRANNYAANLYSQEANVSMYNYSGNNSQDQQQLDERDKQIQQLQQENQFLRTKIKYLIDQSSDLDCLFDSQEKIYSLTSMYLNVVMENTYLHQSQQLNNSYPPKLDIHQIEQDIYFKNSQVDRSLEEFRKRIDQIKNTNRISANFCEQIMYKLSRFIKKVNIVHLDQQSQPQFNQNLSQSQHPSHHYFNNMMNKQYAQIHQFSQQQLQQQQYLIQPHNPLAQSNINPLISQTQQPSNIMGQLPSTQHSAQNSIQQQQQNILPPPQIQSVQSEMINPSSSMHHLSSQNQQQ